MFLYRGNNNNNILFRKFLKLTKSSANQSNFARPKDVNGSADSHTEPKKLRNIGIVAHINAGKTTTTERILYHAGSTNMVGDVDKGNTVTDYLAQERDRGITITSAAVQFKWNKHLVNLIDTPGHVDFTYEVERSLAVLDGAITLLDASAGVEAQTITVWNQAKRYQLPNIIFLNKYDKPQADYRMCLADLKKALEINTTLVQLPVKLREPDKRFTSIVDIIHRQCISWIEPDSDKGNKFVSEPAVESSVLDKEFLNLMEESRERVINKLSDMDDKFASHVLECDKISNVSGELLSQALRRATLECQLSPVLIGSSFKYIGVQQLMNAIIEYLPSPLEREQQLLKLLSSQNSDNSTNSTKNSNASAFIFKVMHDKRLGPLFYAKMLEGSLTHMQKVKILEGSKMEQVKKLYIPFADELRSSDESVKKHDIVVITGLKEAKTGDIITDVNFTPNTSDQADADKDHTKLTKTSPDSYHKKPPPFKLMNDQLRKPIIIPEINRLEPVYFCSIESRSASQQLKLESALSCLAREDPSFTYEIDQLGLITIRGMGKLHLEIIRDRIESEYKIQPCLGPLQISYRETIEGSATEELNVDRMVNSVKNNIHIKLYVRSKPRAGIWNGKMLRLDMSKESTLGKLRQDHRRAIENGILSALGHGPSKGFPLIDVDILLLEFEANRRSGLPVISSTTSQCLSNALQRCSPVLLEPIMLLEVVAPSEFNGALMGDISFRRGLVQSTTARQNGSIVIRAEVPLSTLSDYSEFLRINTSGRGSFSMELHSYFAMSEAERQNVVKI